MELRHLRYFLEITQDMNMTKAAERLHMSQPPLSRQIKQLEEDLGVMLFDRSGKNLKLTPAGSFLQNKARNLLNSVAEIKAATHRISSSSKSWLNIGFVPSTLYGFLPDLIRHHMKIKDVEIGLSEYMTAQQIVALKARDIDIGFGRIIIHDPQIKHEVVLDEPILVALPKEHPLVKRSNIALAALVKENLLLYPLKPRPSYADQVIDFFSVRNLKPTLIQEVKELQTALGLVAAGVGVSLVPSSVQKMRPDVVYVPLTDTSITSPVVMMYRAEDDSEILQQFIKRVRLLSSISKQKQRRAKR